MNFTQLRAFHAVATCGSITKAADQLNVTQPAITRQIKALEHDHGIALFDRRGHRLELTDSGRDLFSVSNQVFGLLTEADNIVSGESELKGGSLRVGADSPFYIMEILAAFKEKYPSVSLTVTMGSANDLFRALNDFELDVALATAVDLAPEFLGFRYARLDLMLLVPVDHVWASRKSIRLEMLRDTPVILREPTSTTRRLFVQTLENAGIQPTVHMELRNQVAVREAVAAGLGIAPEMVGGVRSHERVRRIPILDASVTYHEHIVCRQDRFNLRKIAAFFETAKEVAPSLEERKILFPPI